MKILVLLNHSTDSVGLARITEKNTWEYTARHGYDVIWLRMQWEDAKVGMLRRLRELLPVYDAVVTIGSDVLFMNHAVRFEDLLEADDDVLMALEMIGEKMGYSADGFSPINNDVAIWRNTANARNLIDDIIDHAPLWLNYRLLWQQYLAGIYLANEGKVTGIRFVHPRVMNASLQPCEGQWMPGDFILHLLAMDYNSKRLCALDMLPRVITHEGPSVCRG